ncbi:MAG: AraC family transcriptional regulator [Spirochaetaceae bacterium]|jgi:AraC-like DNA-binding protein|nr:AraC family transcriptional regulator [Spirochaetaceae bacterium]
MKEKTNSEYINTLLKKELVKWLPKQSIIQTAVDGLALTRFDESSHPESCFYQPMIAVVVQGWKYALIGNKEYSYGEGSCMVVGVDMPGVYHITKDRKGHSFLSVAIKLDKYIITQLLTEVPQLAGKSVSSPGAIVVSKVSDEILDAFLRLVKLLDNPTHIPILSPMIIREIHFYLLVSSLGDYLRMANTIGTQTNQIALAINWLRGHYMEGLQVEDLARMVNMAPSTFHRHFQQLTTLSPLQFQKHLRLYEAKRLMALEGKNASTAAIDVGYNSVSQFNREYKRQFGKPPLQNISKKRVTV